MIEYLKTLLIKVDVDPERLEMYNLSAAMGPRWAEICTEFTEKIKRLGPSLVPAEVVVPLDKLGDVMDEIEHKVNQPVVKEGVIIKKGSDGKPEVVILGFIPSDQRKFSYNFVFGLVLSIIKIAHKYGGRPYSTGLYFTSQAEAILGKDKRCRAYTQSARKGALDD